MTTPENNQIIAIYEFDPVTGQNRVVEITVKAQSDSGFGNFITQHFIPTASEAWITISDKFLLKDSPKYIKELSNAKFNMLNFGLDYAEALYEEYKTGDQGWKSKLTAGVNVVGENVAEKIGSAAGVSLGAWALAGAAVPPLVVGGLWLVEQLWAAILPKRFLKILV